MANHKRQPSIEGRWQEAACGCGWAAVRSAGNGSLGAGDLSGSARVGFYGIAKGSGQGLAEGLGLVVGAYSGEDLGVEVDFAFDGKGLKEVADEVSGKTLDGCAVEGGVDLGVRAATAVYGHEGEGLVEGNDGVAHAPDAPGVAEGLPEYPSQGYADVFDQVVPTGLQVTLSVEGYVNEAVAGQLPDHVIQETVAGVYVVGALAVEVNGDVDGGLAGLAFKGGGAGCLRVLRGLVLGHGVTRSERVGTLTVR